MSAQRILVLGTYNRKKGAELRDLLAPHGFEIRTLADFPEALAVEETGQTFAENAALKATLQARNLHHWTLGEDSGLEVDVLRGAPGVYSARFAGEDANDELNNQKLLDELGQTPAEKRSARYVCHATLSDPQGNIRAECEATCRGRIRFEPVGSAGFGYDPLFEVVEYHRTFGELGDTVKSLLSHRARAVRMLQTQMVELVRDGQW